jgi:hypothetical protein
MELHLHKYPNMGIDNKIVHYIFEANQLLKLMKKSLLLLAALLSLVISSCTTNRVRKQTFLELDDSQNNTILANTSIPSLQNELNLLKKDETLNVMIVHGMGMKYLDEFDQTIDHFSKYLELDDLVFSGSYCSDESADTNAYPNIKLFKYSKRFSPDIVKYVQFTYVHWSPATRAYKVRLSEIDNHQNEANVNKLGKDMIVNDGFGDFMALLDKDVQTKAFRALETALLLQYIEPHSSGGENKGYDMWNEINSLPTLTTQHHNKRNIIISSSLGSKLVFEFLSNYVTWLETTQRTLNNSCNITLPSVVDGEPDLILENYVGLGNTDALLDDIQRREYLWYTFTNQIPLFEACKYNFVDNADTTETIECSNIEGVTLNSESTEINKKGYNEKLEINRIAIRKRTTLIGFYDKNDLLGFKIPQRTYEYTATAKEVININIPIQSKELFGLANPLQAHIGAKVHPYVLHIISNGWNGDASSLPKPKEMPTILKTKILNTRIIENCKQ